MYATLFHGRMVTWILCSGIYFYAIGFALDFTIYALLGGCFIVTFCILLDGFHGDYMYAVYA